MCADGTVLISDGSTVALRESIRVLDTFAGISGLVVIYDKSFIVPLGNNLVNAFLHFFTFDLNVTFGLTRYLGIILSTHDDDFFRLNISYNLSSFKINVQNAVLQRSYSSREKNTIFKSLIISKMVFVVIVLPDPIIYFINYSSTRQFTILFWDSKVD